MTRADLEKEIAGMESLRENLTERIHDVSSALIDAYKKLEIIKDIEKRNSVDDLI